MLWRCPLSDFFKATKPGPEDGPAPFHRRERPVFFKPFTQEFIIEDDGREPFEFDGECMKVGKFRHYMDAQILTMANGLGLTGVIASEGDNHTAAATSTASNEQAPSRAKWLAEFEAMQEAIRAAEMPKPIRFIEWPWMGVMSGKKKTWKRRGHMRQNKVVDRSRFIPSTEVYRIKPELYNDGFQYICGHPITIRKIKKILDDGGNWKLNIDRERFNYEWLNTPPLPINPGGA